MPVTKNLNYYYFVEYYQGIDWKNVQNASFAKKNQNLCGFKLNKNDFDVFPEDLSIKSFKLKTVYPGLITGVGIPHQVGGKEESAFGFSFDYVTGIPFIPGSTIKGILRNAFTLGKGEYIKEKLAELGIDPEYTNIHKLECSIFGPRLNDHNAEANGTDVFFDSFIIGTADKTGSFLELDAVTPHNKSDAADISVPAELVGPNPISFIKIKPNVGFDFRFVLKDFDNIITADKKLELFKNIILDIGIGAKTNVGYGNLTEANDNDFYNGEYSDDNSFKSVQSEEKPVVPGQCQKCGKKTGINKKTGEYYKYCSECTNAFLQNKGRFN